MKQFYDRDRHFRTKENRFIFIFIFFIWKRGGVPRSLFLIIVAAIWQQEFDLVFFFHLILNSLHLSFYSGISLSLSPSFSSLF
jgi:hypothetical protein